MADKEFELNNDELDGEELIADEAPEEEAPKNAFRERLDGDADLYDEDFASSIDPNQNPHLSDQLDDADLQDEAEADYR